MNILKKKKMFEFLKQIGKTFETKGFHFFLMLLMTCAFGFSTYFAVTERKEMTQKFINLQKETTIGNNAQQDKLIKAIEDCHKEGVLQMKEMIELFKKN